MLFSRRTPQPEPPQKLVLHFAAAADADAAPHQDLSAIAVSDRTVWLAGDEGTSLERLVRDGEAAFGAPARFALDPLLDLPCGEDEEVDVEGLDVCDGWLWVVGSHASARKKAKLDGGPAEAIERLATVRSSGNRHLLARIPLVAGEDGVPVPARTAPGPDGEERHAARLRGGRKRSALTRALADDPHLGDALHMPAKENGFDVEGIVAAGDRVYLGLRGPVLRGWAVILEVAPVPDRDDPALLKLGRIGPKGRRYRKHFLDLAGLGVRDLCVDGDDVLILAGPTMTLDGRCAVFRWTGAAAAARAARAAGDDAPHDDTITGDDRLPVALELPYGVGTHEDLEHPEGIAFVTDGEGHRALLVVHDSPSENRQRGEHALEADLYRLHQLR